jgi:hypothetical protein
MWVKKDARMMPFALHSHELIDLDFKVWKHEHHINDIKMHKIL